MRILLRLSLVALALAFLLPLATLEETRVEADGKNEPADAEAGAERRPDFPVEDQGTHGHPPLVERLWFNGAQLGRRSRLLHASIRKVNGRKMTGPEVVGLSTTLGKIG